MHFVFIMKSFKVKEAWSWASSIIRHILLLCVCFLSFQFYLYFHFLTLQQKTLYGIRPGAGKLSFFRALTLPGSVCVAHSVLHLAFLRIRSCSIYLCSPVSKVVLSEWKSAEVETPKVLGLSNWLSLSPESLSQSKARSAFTVVRLQWDPGDISGKKLIHSL